MSIFQNLTASLSGTANSLSVRQRLLGVGIVRIVLGAVTAILYGLHFTQRHFLWGADGVLPASDNAAILAQSHAFSLYSLFPSAIGAECLYWLGLVVSLLFAAGLFTRVTSVLFVITTWSLYQRNGLALDGGCNLLVILSFYLIFADLSAFSLDRRLFGPRREGKFSWVAGMLHNFALAACLLQLAVVYFEAGFYKIQGHVWSNGTAIYYILRSSSYSLPGWSDFVWQSSALVTLGTYGTILFEIMHPFLMWHPKLKYLIFSGAVLLHAGIGVLMGLVWFAFTMIGVHAILFDDSEYARAWNWLKGASARIKQFAGSLDQDRQRPQLEIPGAVPELQAAE
jgi:hypothetical protein